MTRLEKVSTAVDTPAGGAYIRPRQRGTGSGRYATNAGHGPGPRTLSSATPPPPNIRHAGIRATFVRSPLCMFMLLAAALGGCGTLDVEGADGFTPASQLWVVRTAGSARTHELVLSSEVGACSKMRAAEQDRIDALARHSERVDGGDPLCESADALYDDIADAYASLVKDGAGTLTIILDRDGDGQVGDADSAPGIGTFTQVGAVGDGRFTAQLLTWGGKFWAEYADAYACADPDTVDLAALTDFQTTEQADLQDVHAVTGGDLTLAEGGDDSWDVTLEGDLAEGNTTIGDLEASFTGSKCEVAVAEGGLP